MQVYFRDKHSINDIYLVNGIFIVLQKTVYFIMIMHNNDFIRTAHFEVDVLTIQCGTNLKGVPQSGTTGLVDFKR